MVSLHIYGLPTSIPPRHILKRARLTNLRSRSRRSPHFFILTHILLTIPRNLNPFYTHTPYIKLLCNPISFFQTKIDIFKNKRKKIEITLKTELRSKTLPRRLTNPFFHYDNLLVKNLI